MAELDLATVRETIRFRGDYQNVRKFPNSSVNREIQKSFGEFYALVDSTHEGFWDTYADVTTIADQAFIALPPRTWRTKAIDRLDGTDYVELRQVGISERNKYGSNTGEPLAYRLSSRGIELYPTPDQAYTLRVLHTPIAPALQEAQPREWYNGWDDYVIESTLIKLDRREKIPHNDRIDALKEIAARVRAEATERRSQEPEYLVIREGYTGMGRFPFGEID